jgi:hypothetical protein
MVRTWPLSDTSITCPCRSSIVATAAHVPLAAAKERATGKKTKYVPICGAVDMAFTPLIFETFGAWDPEMRGFFRRCVATVENRLEEEELKSWTAMTFKSLWRQRLSCTLVRGVAKCLRARARRDFATGGGDGLPDY